MKKIYLDTAATTPVDKKVLEAMLPYFSSRFGNASSHHHWGLGAKKALEKARRDIAQKINADPDEIIFTAGGTESDNLAIRGIAYYYKKTGNHIITSVIEHPAVLNTCKALEKEGFKVTYLPTDKEGRVQLEKLKAVLSEKTLLVTIMHANNEIGTLQPLEKIGKIIEKLKKQKDRKNDPHLLSPPFFHTDACQSFCKVLIDVRKTKVDLLSLSAHKIYGPKGVGALYVRRGIKLTKILTGGHHEYDRRPGTENVAGIVGFASATQVLKEKDIKRMASLKKYLISRILKEVPQSRLNGSFSLSLPNITNFSFKNVEGEALLLLLDQKGIGVSTGSACSSASLEPSHVLLGIGLSPQEAHGSIRLSLGKDTSKEDIDYTIQALKEAVAKLRKISPKRI